MKRRKFIGSSALAIVAGSSFAYSNEKCDIDSSLKTGTILHSVYFWLHKELSKEEEKDFLNYFKVLAKIPGVRSINYGVPAPTEARDVVDHSYSYNLILTFETLEDITAYGIHPEHIKGAKQYSKYWTRVEVRDTLLA